MRDYILEIRNLSKYYSGVKAVDDMSLGFYEGEVHALVGENGAGKSTLIKMLTGAILPTSGNIFLEGKDVTGQSPIEALKNGISAIYQEFNLIPYLSITENIFFGKEIKKGPFLDKSLMNREVVRLLKEMEIELNPQRSVANLGIAFQQIVEIAKAVSSKSKILIMDEPTAPLTNKEAEMLFNIISKLKKEKVTVIYISHRMEEIFKLSDRVSVIRDGKHIITEKTEDVNKSELISHMVGREVKEEFISRKCKIQDNVVMRVNNLTNNHIRNISFELKKGEILGFGGLVGAGRTEVMQAIYGSDVVYTGEIYLNGAKTVINGPNQALLKGIGLIPEDRKNQGALLTMKIKENITFSSLEKVKKGIFIDNVKEKSVSEYYINKLNIKAYGINQLVKNLSGGNQQKVILAKMLATDCNILIFDEPTRGIDVGAKQEIYELMRHLVDVDGKSIIMVSSDMPELIGMSDRILVMKNGGIVGEIQKKDFSQNLVLEYATGLKGGMENAI